MARRTTSSSGASALSRGTGSSKPAASGYRWFRNPTRKRPPLLRRGGRPTARNPRRRASGSASKSIAGTDYGSDSYTATGVVSIEAAPVAWHYGPVWRFLHQMNHLEQKPIWKTEWTSIEIPKQTFITQNPIPAHFMRGSLPSLPESRSRQSGEYVSPHSSVLADSFESSSRASSRSPASLLPSIPTLKGCVSSCVKSELGL